MVTYVGATDFLPADADIPAPSAAAQACQGCELFADATQTVFGTGTPDAELMLVGEQPGDQEDLRGIPFVGPAGQLLVRALEQAELRQTPTWVTNAVKHFRWKPGRGTQRLHQTPSASQSTACRPWLHAELAAVRPRVLVALGATAGKSLFGPSFTLTAARGRALAWPPESGAFADHPTPVEAAFATTHPSAILRAPDDEREAAMAALVSDLRLVAAALTG